MHRAILTVILGFIFWGCPSDGPLDAWAPPDSGYDGGVPNDTGILPDTGVLPDRDGDNIADDVDNCPDVANTDQADGDQDNVGDVCDRCPQTPNGSTQDLCQIVAEREPNEDPASAVALGPFAAEGAAVELIGELEARTGTQAVDTYKITITETTRLRLQLKPTPNSVFQPGAVVTGRNYRYPREGAHAEAVARDLVFTIPGDYYLRIVDRRWLTSGAIHGGANYGYLLQLERTPLAPESLQVEFESNPVEHIFELAYPGEVKVFNNNYGNNRWFIDVETDYGRGRDGAGYDFLLSLPQPVFSSTTTMVADEVAGRSAQSLDPYLNTGMYIGGLFVLDIQKISGPPTPIKLTPMRLSQASDYPLEVEPNDDLSRAQPIRLSVRGESVSGRSDIDWYTFDAADGKFVQVSVGNLTTSASLETTIGEVIDGNFMPLRRLTPGTISYNFGIVSSYAGHYALRVHDPDDTNGSFDYAVRISQFPLRFAIRQQIPLNTTYEGNEEGVYGVSVTKPSRLRITLTSATPNTDLQMALYNPSGTRLLARGSPTISANIPDSSDPYLFHIYNNDSRAGMHNFEIDVRATPQQ